MLIERDDPTRADVRPLLDEHLAEMRATSPPESVHALEPEALAAEGITFFTGRRDGAVIACAAIKRLGDEDAELKSMRTAASHRGQGLAAELLAHIIAEAQGRGYATLYLETGVEPHFAPARRLYARHGFVEVPAFGDYRPDPNSVFMALQLRR